MQRREFVAVTAVALALARGRLGGRAVRRSALSQTANPPSRLTALQEPSLAPEVFSRRLARAQAELTTRK